MESPNNTVYFAGYDSDLTSHKYFNDIFSKYGEIKKLFLHSTKNYGMVQFENYSSCLLAIKSLHKTPPLCLQVNMAKFHKFSKREEMNNQSASEFSETPKHKSKNYKEKCVCERTVEQVYVDEKCSIITPYAHPKTGELYVPLRFATNIKAMLRTITTKNGKIINETFEELKKIDVDLCNRKIIIDGTNNIKIQRNFNNDHSNDTNGRVSGLSSSSDNLKPEKQKSSYLRNSKQNLNKETEFDSANSFSASNELLVSKPKPVISKLNSSQEIKSHITTVELPRNEFTEVTVQTVLNETTGWIQIDNKSQEFEDMFVKTLLEVEENHEVLTAEVGKLVLAKYDDCWFRAIITSVTPKIKVRFIDYGNESEVLQSEILKMSPELAAYPAFAICIKLANGAPCKIQTDLCLKVKPIKFENEIVIVHVENGIYDREELKETSEINLQEPKKHILDKVSDLLLSELKEQTTGMIELITKLDDTKYVGFFLPTELSNHLITLQDLNPEKNQNFKPKVGDIVCAKNSEGWQRAYLIEVGSKFKVAFIDYAVIDDVDEVRLFPEEFSNIPLFSCVFIFDKSDVEKVSNFKESLDFKIKSILNAKMVCVLNDKDTIICEAECLVWDPRIHIPNSSKLILNEEIPTQNDVTSTKEITNLTLKDGDKIRIIMEENGYLFVRTKQTAEILSRVDSYMNKYGHKESFITNPPKVGQYVAAEFEDAWYRAIVLKTELKSATISYIDYGNEETKSYFSLKELSEKMYEEPCALIKIQLKNFVHQKFNESQLMYLANLCDRKVLLTAKQVGEVFDFKTKDSDAYLSYVLMEIQTKVESNSNRLSTSNTDSSNSKSPNLEETLTIRIPDQSDPIIKTSDIPLVDIPKGRTEIIFQEIVNESNGLISVCANKPSMIYKIQVNLQSQMQLYGNKIAPKTPYEPKDDEICFVQHEDKWYRAVCACNGGNEINVFLIDYGIYIDVSVDKIRQIPQEFAIDPALTNFAIFHGVPENPSKEFKIRLHSLLQKNKKYTVEVLQKNEEDECYIIAFPELLEILKNEKLI